MTCAEADRIKREGPSLTVERMDGVVRVIIAMSDDKMVEHVCWSDDEYMLYYGLAFSVCWSEYGRLFVTTVDEEYGNQVRFCPFCGVAAEVTAPREEGQQPTLPARNVGKVWSCGTSLEP